MQDTLVDSQRARRDRLARRRLDEPPVPKRRRRRERAPVRVGETGEREAERRRAQPLVAGGPRAKPGEPRLQLDACAEQHDVALERREAEARRQRLECRRRRALLLRRRLAVRMRLETCADPRELFGQRTLVQLEPVVHSVTCGSEYVSPVTSSGLSAPSTWIRTRYWPGSTCPA
jgi:hypothetical protein